MVTEERVGQLENRVSHMEGVIEQINLRLNDLNDRMNSLENRMNFQIGLTFAVWATVAGVLLAVIFKG